MITSTVSLFIIKKRDKWPGFLRPTPCIYIYISWFIGWINNLISTWSSGFFLLVHWCQNREGLSIGEKELQCVYYHWLIKRKENFPHILGNSGAVAKSYENLIFFFISVVMHVTTTSTILTKLKKKNKSFLFKNKPWRLYICVTREVAKSYMKI